MAGLGERGQRLRRVAGRLEPPPVVPPFYIENPLDEREARARGWHMRYERRGELVFLGASAIDAEIFLRGLMSEPKVSKAGRKRRIVQQKVSTA